MATRDPSVAVLPGAAVVFGPATTDDTMVGAGDGAEGAVVVFWPWARARSATATNLKKGAILKLRSVRGGRGEGGGGGEEGGGGPSPLVLNLSGGRRGDKRDV